MDVLTVWSKNQSQIAPNPTNANHKIHANISYAYTYSHHIKRQTHTYAHIHTYTHTHRARDVPWTKVCSGLFRRHLPEQKGLLVWRVSCTNTHERKGHIAPFFCSKRDCKHATPRLMRNTSLRGRIDVDAGKHGGRTRARNHARTGTSRRFLRVRWCERGRTARVC